MSRPLLASYAIVSLALSALLLSFGLRRGAWEFSLWLVAYVGLAFFALRQPRLGPLVAGALAFLLGFVKTYRSGINLDLGLALIALAVGLYTLNRARRQARLPLDAAGVALLVIAAWSLVSFTFSIGRIYFFRPAPGFPYQEYAFNVFGFSSEEAIIRATVGATSMLLWFGLYAWARSENPEPRALQAALMLPLLANSAVLLLQRHVDPFFLFPAGAPPIGRLNGVTSFSYALGGTALAVFLLLPVWGSRGIRRGILTSLGLLLLAHAVLASGSRAALLTMLLTALLWACLSGVRLYASGRRLAAAAVGAALGLSMALASVVYRLTPPDEATPVGRLKYGIQREGVLGHLYVTRLSSYPLLLRVMQEYPLSGVGAGLYLAEVSKQRDLLMPELSFPEPYLLRSYAPNQFLNTGAELGPLALIALVVVFISVGVKAFASGRGSLHLALSLVAMVAALQFGPELYNSEALVFFWLVVGLAPGCGETPAPPSIGGRGTTLLIAGALLLALLGHALSRPELAVDRQWKDLRWRLASGLHRREPGGRWTMPQGTFPVDTDAPQVTVRWHAGDPGAPEYRADVSFYVDGELVERSLSASGRVRESTLPLPRVHGLKRISVSVRPPFDRTSVSGGDDRRTVGIFLHSVTPTDIRALRPDAP